MRAELHKSGHDFLFIILKGPSILNEVQAENRLVFFCEGSFMDNFIDIKN